MVPFYPWGGEQPWSPGDGCPVGLPSFASLPEAVVLLAPCGDSVIISHCCVMLTVCKPHTHSSAHQIFEQLEKCAFLYVLWAEMEVIKYFSWFVAKGVLELNTSDSGFQAVLSFP